MTPGEYIARATEAERGARAQRGLPPDHLLDFAEFPFAFALDELAAFQRAVETWFEREPHSPAAAYFAAMASASRKDYVQANARMEICGRVKDDGRERMRFGVVPPPSSIALPPVQGAYPTGPCFFLACDSKYFAGYGAVLLKSMADKSPGVPVHIHLMDKNIGTVSPVLAGLPLRTSLTHEDPKALISNLKIHPGGYFGAVRFIRFAEALERCEGPLWMSDADGLVTGETGHLLHETAPVCMRVRAGRLEPFHQYSACLVMGSPASRPYFRRVADILLADLPFAWWGMDQYALFSAAISLEPRVKLLGPELAGVDAATPGLFWFTAGKKKATLHTDDDLYARRFRDYASR